MSLRLVLAVVTIGVATSFVLLQKAQCVHAIDEVGVLTDTDDDFLPDCVEWAALTSATNPDTDGDLTPDFLEVVQRGTPRLPGAPLPMDQEMRVMITGPQAGSSSSLTWMHLFVRFVEPGATFANFQAWIEIPAMPGVRCPFNMLSLGPIIYRERHTGAQGDWVQVSVPLVSASVLQLLLPASIQVEATVGGRYLRSGVSLFVVNNEIATLAPFAEGSYAVQTIAPTPGGGGLSNRVCVLELQEQTTTLAGTLYQVTAADCEDCNELECVFPSCVGALGWVITVPGGMSVIGGTN